MSSASSKRCRKCRRRLMCAGGGRSSALSEVTAARAIKLPPRRSLGQLSTGAVQENEVDALKIAWCTILLPDNMAALAGVEQNRMVATARMIRLRFGLPGCLVGRELMRGSGAERTAAGQSSLTAAIRGTPTAHQIAPNAATAAVR